MYIAQPHIIDPPGPIPFLPEPGNTLASCTSTNSIQRTCSVNVFHDVHAAWLSRRKKVCGASGRPLHGKIIQSAVRRIEQLRKCGIICLKRLIHLDYAKRSCECLLSAFGIYLSAAVATHDTTCWRRGGCASRTLRRCLNSRCQRHRGVLIAFAGPFDGPRAGQGCPRGGRRLTDRTSCRRYYGRTHGGGFCSTNALCGSIACWKGISGCRVPWRWPSLTGKFEERGTSIGRVGLPSCRRRDGAVGNGKNLPLKNVDRLREVRILLDNCIFNHSYLRGIVFGSAQICCCLPDGLFSSNLPQTNASVPRTSSHECSGKEKMAIKVSHIAHTLERLLARYIRHDIRC